MTEALQFIRKHRSTGALIDANLLLVYAVGKYDRKCLRLFPHTKQYSEDYDLVEYLVESFPTIYTTPNILTEVSNLGGKINSERFFAILKTLVSEVQERYCLSRDAASDPIFLKLGLTDAGIMSIAADNLLVLTADWPLYQILRSKNVDAVNINHLRQLEWLGCLGSRKTG
jgi:hypothetical protein